MSKVAKHLTDEGKYQSTFDTYGHGLGNGKSRNAIYKHAKKLKSQPVDFVKTPPSSQPENTQNQDSSDEIPIWDSEENTQNQDFSEWGSVDWDSSSEREIIPNSIPAPIAGLAGGAGQLDMQATGQMIRLGFLGLDRMLTHWGRGVMGSKDWTLTRSSADYDALEVSTVNLMQHYGINVPVSPLVVWGATVGSAYVPPVLHIRKNADPSRKRRSILGRLWPFKRKKKEDAEESVGEDERIELDA